MTERSLSEMPSDATPQGGSPEDARIADLVRSRLGEPGPLLEVLHDVQAAFGYLPPNTTTVVADVLNLSRAEVHGVISFYDGFHTEAPPGVTVAICRGEACQSVGAEALVNNVRSRLGVDIGGRTADGVVGLEQIFCFGNCALGPTANVAGRLHGRLDAARLDALIDEAQQSAKLGA
jgi:formate dehydrogenase subunit gamma